MEKSELKRLLNKTEIILFIGVGLLIIRFIFCSGLNANIYFRRYLDITFIGELIDTIIVFLASIVFVIGLVLLRKEIMKKRNRLLPIIIILLLIAPIKVAMFFLADWLARIFTESGISQLNWSIYLSNYMMNVSETILVTIAMSNLSWLLYKLKKKENWNVKPIISPIILVMILIAEIIIITIAIIYFKSFYILNYNLTHAIYGVIAIIVFVELTIKNRKVFTPNHVEISIKSEEKK